MRTFPAPSAKIAAGIVAIGGMLIGTLTGCSDRPKRRHPRNLAQTAAHQPQTQPICIKRRIATARPSSGDSKYYIFIAASRMKPKSDDLIQLDAIHNN